MDSVDGPDALLVLGLWREPTGDLRVRVTRSTKPRREQPEQLYADNLADVLQAVADWFDEAVTPP